MAARRKSKRKMSSAFKKASAHCRATTKPFSKAFGKCMRSQFKK